MMTERFATAATTIAIAILVLVNTVLHTQVYAQRNYREDEINSVHAALIKTPPEIVQWMAGDVHPPGWRLFADFWVDRFGTTEPVTRWSSQLINLLTFALVFQLARQVIDRRAAFYAVAILGVYGFAANGMYEFRPYAMLVALTTGLHLVFYRWLIRPKPALMIVYVLLGMAAVYTHFYAFFVFAAHAVFLLLFRRFQRKVYLNSVLMWVFIALSFSAWIIPLLGVILGPFFGGYYEDYLGEIYGHLHFRPEAIFGFLGLLSLFAPGLLRRQPSSPGFSTELRLPRHWNLLYPLVLLAATLAVAIVANFIYSGLNARGLQSVVMLVALLMALGLRLLPVQAAVILILILYILAPQNIALQPSNGPYREIVSSMSETYQEDSVLVTEFDWSWRWLMPAAYFLMDFTPDQMANERMFHVIDPSDRAHPPAFPDRLLNVYKSFGAETFSNLLPAHEQLWLLRQGDGNRWSSDIQLWLDRNYALLRSTFWNEPYKTTYELREYLRAPDASGPQIVAGDNMQLYNWSLLDSVEVQPCQNVTIESWWRIANVDRTPFTLNIILADDDGDGQLARTSSVPANVFTSDWIADKFYRDLSALQVPCDINDGSYDILLSVGETISGDDLIIRYPSGDAIGNVYYLTTLHAKSDD